MKIDIKIPEVGESVQEAILAEWYKQDGDHVEKEEPLFVIETDKVTLEVPAEENGTLEILVQAGETVPIGKVVGRIETEAAAAEKEEAPKAPEEAEAEPEPESEKEEPVKAEAAETAEAAPREPPQKSAPPERMPREAKIQVHSPAVRRLAAEKDLDLSKIEGSGPGGRITKGDVIQYLESEKAGKEKPREKAPEVPEKAAAEERQPQKEPVPPRLAGEEAVTRKPMSPIRKRIAARLLEAVQNTAMLTTFNEIDMSRVKTLRDEFKETFHKTHGVRLGFMSFFIRAVVAALKEFPDVNARIEGDEIVYQHHYHIGIAIGAERGLVVPVIRHADLLSFAEIESAIIEFAEKVRTNRIALSDLEGGTFSITNGGIYGSLLSTPILNIPQSGILGMHKIEDRPVAVDGRVEIRPMMYVALSYDHRIVDGKNAVTFLRRIKEFIETPERILMEI